MPHHPLRMTPHMDSALWEKNRGLTAGMVQSYADLEDQARMTGHPSCVNLSSDCTGDFAYSTPVAGPGLPVEDESGGVVASADPLGQIKAERRKVYGEPRENHKGIAQMWAPMLQPWAPEIARGEPVPEHVVALLMALLKIDRCRLVFHKDNYDDCKNYLDFGEEWQSDPKTPIPEQCR